VTASNSPRIISSPLSPRDTEVTVVDLATEFEEMMNDLKFTGTLLLLACGRFPGS
jgi:hypothetical protein